MGYKTTQIKLSFYHFFINILDFFEAVNFHIRRSLHIIRNHDRTQAVKYHLARAKRRIISSNLDNLHNWNNRILSSESFRINDDDV